MATVETAREEPRVPDVRQLCELSAVRALMEGQAASDAALYATDADTLLRLRRLARCEQPRDALEFHVLLAAAGGNHTLGTFLGDVLQRLDLLGGACPCGDDVEARNDHQRLLDAVMSGQQRRAVEVARSHVNRSKAATMRRLCVTPLAS